MHHIKLIQALSDPMQTYAQIDARTQRYISNKPSFCKPQFQYWCKNQFKHPSLNSDIGASITHISAMDHTRTSSLFQLVQLFEIYRLFR